MSLLGVLGISTAFAAPAAGQGPEGGFFMPLLFMVLIVVVFYFLLIRPQTKRAKAQREMIDQVAIGDEVVTAGGIVGKIAKLRDDFVVLQISETVEITLQKTSIANVLPKGSFNP